MKCRKADTCMNFPDNCADCWATSDIYNHYPRYVKKNDKIVRFKTFFGNQVHKAEDKANLWLETTAGINVIDFRYTQASYGDHSICIMYEETNNAD